MLIISWLVAISLTSQELISDNCNSLNIWNRNNISEDLDLLSDSFESRKIHHAKSADTK